MRKNKIFLPMMAISLLFGLGLAACNQPANPSNNTSSSIPAKEKIKVTLDGSDKTEGEVEVEATLQLKASVEGGTWASSNEKVATVDQTGKVTAVAPGNANITVTKDPEQPDEPVVPEDPDEPAVPEEPDVPNKSSKPVKVIKSTGNPILMVLFALIVGGILFIRKKR